jgi:hypothetical protein
LKNISARCPVFPVSFNSTPEAYPHGKIKNIINSAKVIGGCADNVLMGSQQCQWDLRDLKHSEWIGEGCAFAI